MGASAVRQMTSPATTYDSAGWDRVLDRHLSLIADHHIPKPARKGKIEWRRQRVVHSPDSKQLLGSSARGHPSRLRGVVEVPASLGSALAVAPACTMKHAINPTAHFAVKPLSLEPQSVDADDSHEVAPPSAALGWKR